MELGQIHYLCAVMETSSFTRAAERCLVSQSAIPQQVKALKGELGFEAEGVAHGWATTLSVGYLNHYEGREVL